MSEQATTAASHPPFVVPPLPRLEPGDCLDQRTFHERYKAMPSSFRAELIGGIVIVPSPMRPEHTEYHVLVNTWLGHYWIHTPGTRARDNATAILGEFSEPQPDDALVIDPECAGQTWYTDDGYAAGPPELIAEVAFSTESIDLNRKRQDYEEAGVLEYMVVVLRQRAVRWFSLKVGAYVEVHADSDGVIRSAVFPGLWLDVDALLRLDGKKLLETLERGLADASHAAFVQHLAERRKPSA